MSFKENPSGKLADAGKLAKAINEISEIIVKVRNGDVELASKEMDALIDQLSDETHTDTDEVEQAIDAIIEAKLKLHSKELDEFLTLMKKAIKYLS